MTTVEFGERLNDGMVIAMGYFDGMHLGHREILAKAKQLADERGLKTAITTFSDSPNRKDTLYTYFDRKKLFAQCGADICVSLCYARICNMTGEDFLHDLFAYYGITHVVCGENYKFGADGCDVTRLRELAQGFGVGVTVMPLLDVGGVRVSSTAVKAFLKTGDADAAKKLLGTPYHIRGEVTYGDGRGRVLGIPTANLDLPIGIMEIKRGVYGTYTELDGKLYRSVTNYGARPTFLQSRFAIETNLLGYEGGSLLGKEITVYFHRYLRPIRKYRDKDELLARIAKDKEWTDL